LVFPEIENGGFDGFAHEDYGLDQWKLRWVEKAGDSGSQREKVHMGGGNERLEMVDAIIF